MGGIHFLYSNESGKTSPWNLSAIFALLSGAKIFIICTRTKDISVISKVGLFVNR